MHRVRITKEKFSEFVVEELDWPAPLVKMGVMFRCPILSMCVHILFAIYDILKESGSTCKIYLNVYFVSGSVSSLSCQHSLF